MSDVNSPLHQSLDRPLSVIQLNNKVGTGVFVCDEEPHMLSMEQGFGYYPLQLGQKLKDGKYEIVRKLGWGATSSVWLTRVWDENYPNRFAAVKVLTVSATAGVLFGVHAEVESLERIAKTNLNHPGYKHCLRLRRTFLVYSNHGPHICLVTDVLGPNIAQFLHGQTNHAFSVPLVKRIVKQTLLALDYLHRDCDLVHTDLKPDNCLLYVQESDAAISEYLKECPSTAYETRYETDVSLNPIITVKSQPLPAFGLNDDMSNLFVCLADYSQAARASQNLIDNVQPVLLRAPEVILGSPWSTPIDIWSTGCIVFEYLVGRPLFQLREYSTVKFEDVHLQQMQAYSGPFPATLLETSTRKAEYFDEKGTLLRITDDFPGNIEQVLRDCNRLEESEIPAASVFIKRCLTIDPTARPSALNLLDDDWLKDACTVSQSTS